MLSTKLFLNWPTAQILLYILAEITSFIEIHFHFFSAHIAKTNVPIPFVVIVAKSVISKQHFVSKTALHLPGLSSP